MNVRIISGKFGGRSINSPNSQTTHPMSERIRGSMFNIIGDDIINAEVLDAFAGTGSIGLEAISRGAKSVTFIDRDRLASKILSENIKLLDVESKCDTFQIGLSTWIDKSQDKTYDFIFVDPPFNNPQLSTVARLMPMLKPNGLMILSYIGRGEAPAVEGFVVVDNRRYGNAALTFYRHKK